MYIFGNISFSSACLAIDLNGLFNSELDLPHTGWMLETAKMRS